MIGLGVSGSQPAPPHQPPLANGIHLRWAFDRDLGFPWHGFFLFRRPARAGTPLCLSAVTGGLKPGALLSDKHHTALGVLSSNTNLVLTEDFAPSAQVEFALEGRTHLRFELPAGEPARRVNLHIGFLTACLEVEKLALPFVVKPGTSTLVPKNPLGLQGLTFEVKAAEGGLVAKTQFDSLPTASGQLVGLACGYGLTLRLAAPSNSVELHLTRTVQGDHKVEAFDPAGNPVASVPLQGPVNQPERVRLRGQNIVRVEVRTIRNNTYVHRVCTDALRPEGGAAVKVTAFSGATPVRSVSVASQAGQTVVAAVEADAITAVEIGPGRAALVDLCYVPVAQDATQGWEPLGGFQYPLGLPVSHPDYPCSVPAPKSFLTQRVHYPPPPEWDEGSLQPLRKGSFELLHEQLVSMVAGGPGAGPMAERVFNAPPAESTPPDPQPPKLTSFYILDMLLLGALHPALAQLIGLYWVDQTDALGVAYDYLIVADHAGVGQRNAATVLATIQSSGFAQLDGFIVFNKRRAAEPPLPPPARLQAFELPGGGFPDAQGQPPQANNAAGLTWDAGWDGSGDLLPERPVMNLVWRADLGDGPKPAPFSGHDLITKLPPNKPRPVMVVESRLPQGFEAQLTPGWPPFPLHFIDRNLRDRWYSYQLSSIDLFGRHSANSPPALLRLLDKVAPPATGVEAYALDPEDPFLLADDAYTKWRQSLDPSVRQTLVGLRVRWAWPATFQRQAPDTDEFRIYFHPGAALPIGHDKAVNWQERFHVVKYAEGVTFDAATGDRLYEVFLPPSNATNPASIPLNPSPAEPIVYAYVGVSAADAKPHASDQRAAGQWGKRPGNEGAVGPPARIYRALRTPPPAPESVMNDPRYYASPADYYSRSFFTYRWKPQKYFKLHVYRALDDAVFKAAWAQRHLTPKLDAGRPELFPLGWGRALRDKVLIELNVLNAFVRAEADAEKAMARYRRLSDAALRVLASLPASEAAFTQLTIEPLDPDKPASENRRGPDSPDDLPLDPSQRAFIDTLDGRAANRYFYRAALVDAAHNLGPLGPSTPPVYLPKVVPPRAPSLTKVLGGDRRITIKWASNRDPDLAEYRVYRADTVEATRDLRLMTLVHTEAVPKGDPMARPDEVVWDDAPVGGMATFYYRLVAVDASGNVSAPSPAAAGRAFDDARPDPPSWYPPAAGASPDEVLLSWASPVADLACLVQRRSGPAGDWQNVSVWLQRGSYAFTDSRREVGVTYTYRLRVIDAGGRSNKTFVDLNA